MNARSCCPPRSEQRSTVLRRGLWSSTCLVPAVLLALAPKCPVCLAAYLTLVSGVGISVTAAEHVRTVGAGLAAAGVIVLAWRYLRRRARLEADPARREAGTA